MAKKTYNGVQYDTDLDYTTEIQKAASSGNNARAAVLEKQRNAKIGGEGLSYGTTSQYAEFLPKTDVAYDMNTDYKALMDEAAARGDYTAAFNYERQRNAKITGEALDMPTTSTYAKYDPETRYKYDPTQDPEYQHYRSQMRSLYDKIMGREDFSYDAEKDPVYQQYSAQYMRQGKQAMRDTIGQASALTGGYGSTYAENAGEQAYEAYLERLNDVLPELYGAAYDRYRGERNDLLSEYQLVSGLESNAYERGYNDWSTRLGLERADEETAYTRRQNEQALERQDAETAFTRAIALIQNGVMPSADQLKAAGISQAQAEQMVQRALMSFNSGGTGGGSSSGRRSSGRSSGSSGGGVSVTPQATYQPTGAGTVTDKSSAAYRLTGGAKDTSHLNEYQTLASAEKYWSALEQLSNGGSSVADMLAQVKKWESAGVIDQRTAAEMITSYKLNRTKYTSGTRAPR